LRRQVGALARTGRPRYLHQRRSQSLVAVPRPAALPLAGTLPLAQTHPRPRRQVALRREHLHVDPGLRQGPGRWTRREALIDGKKYLSPVLSLRSAYRIGCQGCLRVSVSRVWALQDAPSKVNTTAPPAVRLFAPAGIPSSPKNGPSVNGHSAWKR